MLAQISFQNILAWKILNPESQKQNFFYLLVSCCKNLAVLEQLFLIVISVFFTK